MIFSKFTATRPSPQYGSSTFPIHKSNPMLICSYSLFAPQPSDNIFTRETKQKQKKVMFLFSKIHWHLQNHKKATSLFLLEMKLVWRKVRNFWLYLPSTQCQVNVF